MPSARCRGTVPVVLAGLEDPFALLLVERRAASQHQEPQGQQRHRSSASVCSPQPSPWVSDRAKTARRAPLTLLGARSDVRGCTDPPRSVASIWRSSAFISSTVSRRLARTARVAGHRGQQIVARALHHAARIGLLQLGQHRARQLHQIGVGQRGGAASNGQRARRPAA